MANRNNSKCECGEHATVTKSQGNVCPRCDHIKATSYGFGRGNYRQRAEYDFGVSTEAYHTVLGLSGSGMKPRIYGTAY